MRRASILLADDNPAILRHVSRLLEKNQQYDLVAAVRDGKTVLQRCSQLKPDVIILDISMGSLSGIDVAQSLRDAGCQSKIIFLTVHEDPDFLNAAMGAGGSAYVVKSRLDNDLMCAISAVLAEKIFVSASMVYEPLRDGTKGGTVI